MQEIKPTYVTLEQAKLLFEKGFPGATEDDAVYTIHDKTRVYPLKYIKEGLFYHAPEQWQVVEWLRVKKGIWVSTDFSEVDESFTYKIHLIKSNKLPRIFTDCGYDSPQEAYSAAFDYILKELI